MRSTVSQAARSLARSPAFSVTAVVSIGIGVALACSVFANVQASVFPALPYPSSDELVEIWPTARPGSHQPVDYLLPAQMLEWAGSDMRYLEHVAGRGLGAPLILQSTTGAERVTTEPIVGDWFGTLGVTAFRGRTLGPDDLRPGATPAAVVSYTLWRDRLGESDAFPGSDLTFSDVSLTVVGVMPEDFERESKIWVPLEALPGGRRPVAYAGVARLREGASVDDAAGEMSQLAALQVASDSALYGGFGATVRPFGEFGRGAPSSLWVLGAVVSAVLLGVLSNLANLFLVRTQRRSVLFAVRAALGARRRDLAVGFMAESLIIAGLGGGLGLVLSVWGKGIVEALVPGLASEVQPTIGGLAVALVGGLTVLAAAVVGFGALRRMGSIDLRSLLQRGSAGAVWTPGERMLYRVFLAGQIAVSAVLVTTAFALNGVWRSFEQLDVGYDAARVVRAVPEWEARELDGAAQWAFGRQVASRLRARPEVQEVALWRTIGINYPPRPEFAAVYEGPPRDLGVRERLGSYYEVEPGTVDALGIRLIRGREFTLEDGPEAPLVALVSRRAAEVWWPSEDPLGRQLKLGQDGDWLTIVGVVEDFQSLGLLAREGAAAGFLPQLLRPAAQSLVVPAGWHALGNCYLCDGVVIGVRASGETAAAAEALRQEIGLADPGLPLVTLSTFIDEQTSAPFYRNQLLVPGRLAAAGALVAIMMSLIGIAGVVAQGISRRTRELGVRIALGASRTRILVALASESLLTGIVGLALGLVLIVTVHGTLVRSVYHYLVLRLGGETIQPTALAGTALLMMAATVGVTLTTARRALALDPVEALRSE